MKSKAIKALAGKMFQEARDFVPEVSKTDLAMAGIGGAGAGLYAHKEGYLEDSQAVKNIAILGAGALATGGLYKTAKMATQKTLGGTGTRQAGLELYRQNLQEDMFHYTPVPFYGGGKAQQMLSFAIESIVAGGRALRRGFDYRASEASKISGINPRTANDIGIFEDAMATAGENIKNLNTKGLSEKKVKALVKKELKPVNDATKVLHNQFIQDYVAGAIYNDVPKKEITEYAEKFVKLVDPKDYYKTNKIIPKKAIDNMISVQGLDPVTQNFKLAELTNAGMRQGGDVLRGIQFDRRSANLFKRIYDKKLTPKEIRKEMADIFGENAIRDLGGGKIQVVFSPELKSNLHWGGYAGTLIWDPRKPKGITMLADDLSDLWGMHFGNNVLNVTNAKHIPIPKILKDIAKKAPTNASNMKKVDRKTLTGDKEDIDAMKFVASKMTASKKQIGDIRDFKEVYEKTYGEAKPSMEFVASRLAAGSGILGTGYALYDSNFGED